MMSARDYQIKFKILGVHNEILERSYDTDSDESEKEKRNWSI